LFEGVRESTAEGDIWYQEGGENRRRGETAYRRALCSVLLTNYYSGDKYRRMRLTGLVACMGERRSAYSLGWGYLRGIDHWENLGVYRRIILK